jgi:hypothetical protein
MFDSEMISIGAFNITYKELLHLISAMQPNVASLIDRFTNTLKSFMEIANNEQEDNV